RRLHRAARSPVAERPVGSLRSTSQLRRRSCFASRFIKLLDPRINVNVVVTAHRSSTTTDLPCWFRPVAIDIAANRVI
ncbi:MAG TPA: hypothetical protein VFR71_03740, partial [Methyloceanibacter sp.]|nr:hypothetical protein [Methyloceanibacter sp.]